MAKNEFLFHWDGGSKDWDDLHVVSFELVDEMSRPYELKVTLVARDGKEFDPEELVGALATLRIATTTDPAVRVMHGIIAEAEELGSLQDDLLYRVTLLPPVLRAAHRSRSRIFLERSTKEIIEAVLTGDPMVQPGEGDNALPDSLDEAFKKPETHFVWRLLDTTRVEDAAVRPYTVQYNESDFDFVSRLLEEEGIAYHFEHTGSVVRLVLSDHDDGRARLAPFDALSSQLQGRDLRELRLGKRLRPGKVSLVDYNWRKPSLDMQTDAAGDGDDLFVTAYPGRYPDAPAQGAPLAKAMLERFQTEARFASAKGSCRLLSAGTVFQLAHEVSRHEGEYLVTRAETRGFSMGELRRAHDDGKPPFEVHVELARRGKGDQVEESRFRPAKRTPKPRIVGMQTATVTAEPGTKDVEINVGGPEGGEIGCVRLKFAWDVESKRHEKEPTSTWVRVSQMFAGAGGGSLAHPRVGTEVVVDYLDGDPDRPLVVGRVYNGAQLPPAKAKGSATVTTLKSLSSPGGKVYNELLFDDTAGEERVHMNAGKNWSSVVGNDRHETISNDSHSKVNANRNEHTSADRSAHVGGANSETITGNETVTVTGRQSITANSGQDVTVNADRVLTVSGPHTATVGPETYTVKGAETLTITGAKSEAIGAAYDLAVGAAMTTSVAGAYSLSAPVAEIKAPVTGILGTAIAVQGDAAISLKTTALLANASGMAQIQGGMIEIVAAAEITLSAGGSSIKISGAGVEINGGSVKIAGGSVDITGGTVSVN